MNVARLVFPAIRWHDRALEDVWPEVSAAIDLGVGGFVVFGGDVSTMRELAERAWDYTDRSILFAADLERGAGQQLAEATPLPPPAALATIHDDGLYEAAQITAQEAAAAGIGWLLAPVADLDSEPANPIVGTRSFGGSPAAVADCVQGWVKVAQAEGVAACAKHFPGHGRTVSDSHAGLPTVAVERAELEDDLLPFRAAVDAGVASVMMAHVAYTALDASGLPASLSPHIVGLLRDELGFDGVVVTDAMIMSGVREGVDSEEAAAVAAVRAGCDVVLYPGSYRDTVRNLELALRLGALPRRRVLEAVERVERLAAVELEPDALMALSSYERALELAVESIVTLRGVFPEWPPGMRVRLHVIDDDRQLEREVPQLAGPGQLPPDRGRFEAALRAHGAMVVPPDAGGQADDAVAVFSDVRGWKGRARLSSETVEAVGSLLARAPEAIVVLFGHPRLAEQLPPAPHVVCAWSGDPLMQEAAAARLAGAQGG